MKKLIFPLLFAVVALSCNKDKLLKDVQIYLGTDLLLNPMSVQVFDANPENAPGLPDGLTVEIGGPDKDKIYSILGERAIKLDGPMLNLGIRRVESPSPEQPIWFTITARAPGYLDASALYSISDTSFFRTETLPMIKISAPPEGVSIKEADFLVDQTGAMTDVISETANANGVDQTTKITIPKGTKMFPAGGSTPVSGSGKLTIVQFSPNAAGNFVPDGTILESNGKQKKPGSTAPASAFIVNINVGGSVVETFSTPIEALVELDKTLINPATQTLLTVGDSIPVWRYDEATSIWHEEPKTIATSPTSGKLSAKLLLPHLTQRNVGFFPPNNQFLGIPGIAGGIVLPPAASVGGKWTFSSTITPTCPGYFYTEIRTLGGTRLFAGDVDYFQGRSIQLSSILRSAPAIVNLRIFDGSADLPETLLFSKALNALSNQNVDLGASLPVLLTASLDVSGTCDLSDQVLPSVAVSFRPARAENDFRGWRTLGRIVRGQGCTPRLAKGSKYDFMVPQFPVPIWAITIPSADEDIAVKGDFLYQGTTYSIDETLRIRYVGAGGNAINLTYRDIDIPDSICEKLREMLGQ